MNTATLRLFNAIPAQSNNPITISRQVQLRTIANGYILDPNIQPSDALLNDIESVIGISGAKANAAFHKSWKVVRDSSMESLVLQQITHYLTTYGFQSVGIYQEESVYIPHETLEIPAITKDLRLVVVRTMNNDELLEAIIDLGSGIALARETLDDIMCIVKSCSYNPAFVNSIENRELKTLLYEYYDLVPTEPVDYLRYVITKLTGESLLIKNDFLIGKIRESKSKTLDGLLDKAPDDLPSIFYRYKPLFLALKSVSRNKTFFNRLRKRAQTEHIPLPNDYLNSVTSQIMSGTLDLANLKSSLESASAFRKIRLAYALQHRLNAKGSILYKVRNGRGWATDFDWSEELNPVTDEALEVVIQSLVEQLSNKVAGKTVYIPETVEYALPASEKQFTGNFPSGSSIIGPDDLIVGIHWQNTHKSIDLDLSILGESGKIGWDARYRSEDLEILFSGDVTDAPAPNGATELFYLKGGLREAKILMLNFYNYSAGDEVDAKIIVAGENPKHFRENYMVDPNNIIATANITVNCKQNVLGLIARENGFNRVYFSHVSTGTSISSSNSTYTAHARNYLIQSQINSLSLREILVRSGAIVRDEYSGSEDIDLAPERINKSTIIDLLR